MSDWSGGLAALRALLFDDWRFWALERALDAIEGHIRLLVSLVVFAAFVLLSLLSGLLLLSGA